MWNTVEPEWSIRFMPSELLEHMEHVPTDLERNICSYLIPRTNRLRDRLPAPETSQSLPGMSMFLTFTSLPPASNLRTNPVCEVDLSPCPSPPCFYLPNT